MSAAADNDDTWLRYELAERPINLSRFNSATTYAISDTMRESGSRATPSYFDAVRVQRRINAVEPGETKAIDRYSKTVGDGARNALPFWNLF